MVYIMEMNYDNILVLLCTTFFLLYALFSSLLSIFCYFCLFPFLCFLKICFIFNFYDFCLVFIYECVES